MPTNGETVQNIQGKGIVRCVHCGVKLKDSKIDKDGKETGDIKSIYRMAIHRPVCHSDRYGR